MPHCRCLFGRQAFHLSNITMFVLTSLSIVAATSFLDSKMAFVPPSPSLVIADVSTGQPWRQRVPLMAKKKRKRLSSNDDQEGDEYSNTNVNNASSNSESATIPPRRTLKGGPSLIFEMARRMLVWDDDLYQGLNDASNRGRDDSVKVKSSTQMASVVSVPPTTPRWRPSPILQQSVSNVNPTFRTSSPIMTNAGYAEILRRNSRKKNKPSMWRHCLRVYDKMADLQTIGSHGSGVEDTIDDPLRKKAIAAVRRKTVHHEAALVAASKLGLWEEALKIYHFVAESSEPADTKSLKAVVGIGKGTTPFVKSRDYNRSAPNVEVNTKKDAITDNMILSIVSACVKGSRVRRKSKLSYVSTTTNISQSNLRNCTNAVDPVEFVNATNLSTMILFNESNPVSNHFRHEETRRQLTLEERRRPLDAARDILLTLEEKHGIPLVSRHINQLASGYLRLGLRSDATDLINSLGERSPPLSSPTTALLKNADCKENRTMLDNTGFEGVPLGYWKDADSLIDDSIDAYNNDNYDDEEMQLNIHQVRSKDRGSYALLVQGAVMDEDWGAAVQELQRMTEVGLHPNSRNLNAWSEVMERNCRPTGARCDNVNTM